MADKNRENKPQDQQNVPTQGRKEDEQLRNQQNPMGSSKDTRGDKETNPRNEPFKKEHKTGQ